MWRGSQEFLDILTRNRDRPVLVYGDPDTDGLISLLFMCQFCEMLGLSYRYYVNNDRQHGFKLRAEDIAGYLLLASDFTITQKEVEWLVGNDVAVLSTDHHDCQPDFIHIKDGVVINNQYPFELEEDRYLSGAGVFYELVCSLYPDFRSDLRDALVGMTLLSDVREIENDKARRYLRKAYSADASRGYVHYLVASCSSGDFGFGAPRFDRSFLDFSLNPMINALLRADRVNDAVDFILGRGLTQFDARGLQRSLMLDMKARASVYELTNVDFIFVDAARFTDYDVRVTSYIGLYCNDYQDKHGRKSVLGVVTENNCVIRASFRGRYDDLHYRSAFQEIGIDAQGHQSAFGIQNFYPDIGTWKNIDDLVGDLELNHHQTVTVLETSNLSLLINQKGQKIATENCFVRDMYRTYIRYTGRNSKIVKQTYRTESCKSGEVPDIIQRGSAYKYVLDSDGNKVTKYIEYVVDGRTVKSFGVAIEDGFILPVLEKGYLALYVRNKIE